MDIDTAVMGKSHENGTGDFGYEMVGGISLRYMGLNLAKGRYRPRKRNAKGFRGVAKNVWHWVYFGHGELKEAHLQWFAGCV
jgi:hypothetical protein